MDGNAGFNRSLIWVLALVVCGVAAPGPAEAVPGRSRRYAVQTPLDSAAMSADNLQTAYYGERNASERYAAYAAKADEEGYGQVASMFRAIARGEEIHAANIGQVVVAEGGALSEAEEPIISLSTRENLESSVLDQTYEFDVMYPEFLKWARKERHEPAIRLFEQNLAPERLHLAWCRQVLQDLDGYKGYNVEFLVCSHCGATFRSVKDDRCEVCGESKDAFEKVR